MISDTHACRDQLQKRRVEMMGHAESAATRRAPFGSRHQDFVALRLKSVPSCHKAPHPPKPASAK
jgi:hypothetical protein